jgi:AraC-like DNA-binding protein
MGEKLVVGDAALRRIVTRQHADMLHRHYVPLSMQDMATRLKLIQIQLQRLFNLPAPM